MNTFTVDQAQPDTRIEFLREEFRKSQEKIDELTSTNAMLVSRQRAIVIDIEDFFQSYAEEDPTAQEFTIKVEDINEFLAQYGAGPMRVMQKFLVSVMGTFEYDTVVEAPSADDAEDVVRDELAYARFDLGGVFSISDNDYETELTD